MKIMKDFLKVSPYTSDDETLMFHLLINRENAMQWNTPTAIDFRFGFEITMYIAAR